MNPRLIRIAIRALLTFTSRHRALDQAEAMQAAYLKLARGLDSEAGRRPVKVPPMPGIDREMRRWSFYMILAHNTIVNRCVTAAIEQLARDEAPHGPAVIDFKSDVLPDPSVGEEQVGDFANSVRSHVGRVKRLGRLRGTRTSPHPLFGAFDAHLWNSMFAFHLKLHYRQARYVVRRLNG